VSGASGEIFVEATISGPAQWTILCSLAERHYEATKKGSEDQTDQTLSLEELGRLCGGDASPTRPASVERTIRRLNKELGELARRQSHMHFVDLIEDHVPPGTNEKRAALEEIEVRFVNQLPAPAKPDT
jgi:hypothetical protein